jgi:Protein of unknown function (DUF1194)
MRPKTLLFLALLAAAMVPARSASTADLALVLLTDVSKSMDDGEYALVKAGYQAAFADPEVIARILGNTGGVAIAYVEFSGNNEFKVVQGWDLLRDAASTRAFGEAVAAAPRSAAGETALAASLGNAVRLLEEGGFGDARLVIDVASDHPSDGGRSAPVRDAAVAAGITINALPLIDHDVIGTFDGHLAYSSTQQWGWGGMAEFYRRDIIGGPGSFMVEVHDFSDFGEALKRKLLLELVTPDDKDGGGVPVRMQTAAAMN